MSDEYGANSGFKGSLVNNSAAQTTTAEDDLNYKTGNYPPTDDSTASGGYSSSGNVWSDKAQRGRADIERNDGPATGLLGQSVNGISVMNELEDAKQGRDEGTRREFQHEARRDFGQQGAGLNPYGADSLETKREAGEMLESKIHDARSRQYESGGAASVDGDVGAI
ncbi:hypothetical protein EIP91_011246 [Steccherinum ochraceum]|uniref:Uncharacterized protein n=1 Tax=Steccherinum ochraceum TaxID=92696 RepID=A0A4R0RI81_9APHY|nr:hypothetical protein EIP91_011246 [Steccherinum ochraceum]